MRKNIARLKTVLRERSKAAAQERRNERQKQTSNVEAQSAQRTLDGASSATRCTRPSPSVERLVKHPLYGKYIRRTTKLLAHDENERVRTKATR